MSDMAFDFKKEYREFYLPPAKPGIVRVPPAAYLAVRGEGDPNKEGGAYQAAIGVLYALAYTIKMSKKGAREIAGYYDFVVPPLEGFWWQDGVDGVDYARKDDFRWISVIRVPEFVNADDFAWAQAEVARKKGIDASGAELLHVDEGLCVQCLHVGPYDDEPATVALMHEFAARAGYVPDFTGGRLHHEIYLSDARKTAPEKLKTVIRHPVRQKEEDMADLTAQAKELWGGTEAWAEFEKRAAGRTTEEERGMGEELMALFAPFAKMAADGVDPAAPEAQAAARRIQAHITEHFYPCTDEIFAGLGAMYGAGGDFTRNINKAAGPGAAEFASRVIAGL